MGGRLGVGSVGVVRAQGGTNRARWGETEGGKGSVLRSPVLFVAPCPWGSGLAFVAAVWSCWARDLADCNDRVRGPGITKGLPFLDLGGGVERGVTDLDGLELADLELLDEALGFAAGAFAAAKVTARLLALVLAILRPSRAIGADIVKSGKNRAKRHRGVEENKINAVQLLHGKKIAQLNQDHRKPAAQKEEKHADRARRNRRNRQAENLEFKLVARHGILGRAQSQERCEPGYVFLSNHRTSRSTSSSFQMLTQWKCLWKHPVGVTIQG